MLDKESTYICECTDVSVDGKGIARVGNDVVFAGGMIPGERARIRITGKKGKISLGTVEEILSASSFRVRSECPYAGRCGGCSLSSMAYEEQLRYKLKHVNDCLEKIGKTDITADTIIESPKRMGYRNKLSVQVRRVGGELALCYSSNEGEGLVPIDRCLLADDDLNRMLSIVSGLIKEEGIEAYDPSARRGYLRRINIRKTRNGGISVLFETASRNLEPIRKLSDRLAGEAGLKKLFITVGINRSHTEDNVYDQLVNIKGRGYLEETVNGIRYRIRPESFFQVNTDVAEKMFSFIREEISNMQISEILDLYCGVGMISLQLADLAESVTGIEIIPGAVEDARHNAEDNGISHARFSLGNVGKQEEEISTKPEIIIIDPPRKGCSREALEYIRVKDPSVIVYVSCDPSTLARDLRLLSDRYRIMSVRAFDMFPQTTHVETVILLCRADC